MSKSRFLLVANYPERFAKKLMAEIRGWVDEGNHSPFWDAIGRKFFQMELVAADRINSFGNYRFIEELMPEHPIYIELLPKAARKVVGVTHEESTGARRILESEGLKFRGKVDVFDGGPCLDADQGQVRAIKNSKTAKVVYASAGTCKGRYLISNPALAHFRAISGPAATAKKGEIGLTKDQARALGVKKGGKVRYVELISTKKKTNA